jgi:Ca2+-binding RTX toxin-like protein
MATTFDVLFLGTLPLIDTTQGNEIAENAAGLLGSYGSAVDPLSENAQTLSANFLGFDDNATYDTDNRDLLGLIAEYDSFRINGGTAQNFDALSVYDATITYFDGTTATISAVVFQDVNGNTYLAPELALNADQAALTAKPITSLSLNSVLSNNGDLQADRIAGDFKTVVDGTTGNDTITLTSGYVDVDGDSITTGDDFVLAGDGDDFVNPDVGNDVVYGGLGNDTIDGGNQNDTLYGGDGADSIIGGDGNDSILGGDGDDHLQSGAGSDTVFGDAGNDVIAVSDNHDTNTIDGGSGYDQLVFATPTSTSGVTVTWTGEGAGTYDFNTTTSTGTFTGIEQSSGTLYADTYDASAISAGVVVFALDGDDTFIGGSGGDYLSGDAGNDSVHAGAGDDTIDGGAGVDYLKGQSGDDSIVGGSGDDTLTGDVGADTLDGGLDNDSIAGGSGSDVLLGDDGDDNIRGDNMWLNLADYPSTVGTATTLTVTNTAEGPIELWYLNFSGVLEFRQNINVGETIAQAATTGDTYVLRSPDGFYLELIEGGNQTVVYGAGGLNDSIDGGAGNDTIFGEFGDDSIVGGRGADSIDGGYGNDSLSGGSDNDTIFGGDGDDTLDGVEGNDSLGGGSGDDLLTGGIGDDDFIYNVGDGLDTISDFNTGNTGALLDGDTTNNDFIDLSSYYDSIFEVWADQADDGILNQSNTTDTKGNTTDYSDNAQFGAGQGIVFTGATANSGFFATDNTGVVCFARGTLILTLRGEVPIERLSPGDSIVTRDNGPQPLVWVASRKLGMADLTRAPKLRPIRLAPDLIGAHAPLIVSPQHAVLFRTGDGDEQLVRATHLARMRGGKARVMQGCRAVSYFHLAFEAHQIIFANGAATESFYPGPQAVSALAADARQEISALFPDLVPSRAKDTYGSQARQVTRFCDLPDHLGALAQARW